MRRFLYFLREFLRYFLRCCQNTFIALAAVIVLWVSYVALKEPSNDANWQKQYALLPAIKIDQDIISISHVRDFRYNADQSIATSSYLNENYALSELKDAWYGISHFGENGLAHVLLSFEFADDKFLVVSIEARLQEKDIDGYSPIKGLFGSYTKTIVLATERDIIGLRTHIRSEPFYLYKLNLPELYSKALLLNYLRKAQTLNTEPAFYNSIVNNCMTGLLVESNRFKLMSSWLDTRIFLPGNSDELAYELGLIDNSAPFEALRMQALVDPLTTAIEDINFSRNIRAHN